MMNEHPDQALADFFNYIESLPQDHEHRLQLPEGSPNALIRAFARTNPHAAEELASLLREVIIPHHRGITPWNPKDGYKEWSGNPISDKLRAFAQQLMDEDTVLSLGDRMNTRKDQFDLAMKDLERGPSLRDILEAAFDIHNEPRENSK